MEKNPKRKTDRTAQKGLPEKVGKEGRKGKAAGKGIDKTRDTAHDRLSKALAAHEKALGKNPEDAAAWAGKAAVFLRHRMYRASLKAIEKALEIEPDDPGYLYEKSFVLLQLDREEDALQALDRLLEINPDSDKAWNLRTSVLCRLISTKKPLLPLKEPLPTTRSLQAPGMQKALCSLVWEVTKMQ
ncbi:tetratricopeptide repeat protein [Methanosarcina sp. MSH10X1]|uniref:tetratricopeptide repeat protein n=1 Tax=Methanosarcina sp. MSH10X1 TaxID=2507075 RepID=UPI001F0CB6F6|nr:tetratricopeptide repeat protein [Methanosarcina sp. MSH10X1]